MSSPQTTKTTVTKADLEAVAQAIRERDDYVIVTHENPDGDALGSMIALKLALDQLGKRSRMYLPGTAPVPFAYRFMDLSEVIRGDIDDLIGHPVIAVDTANEDRIGKDQRLFTEAPQVVVIDHHHDNNRFGDVNLVVAKASSASEVLFDVFAELGVKLTPEMAEALYIALVTDTGRFQYSNTTPRSLRIAAELLEAGADGHRVFQYVYETIEFPHLKLIARALEHAELFEDGSLVISYLLRDDFKEAGANGGATEGVIDYLRAIDGVEMSVLIQEMPEKDGHRVSLRSARDRLDVSEIARKLGGGGHTQAAGFGSPLSVAELSAFLHAEYVAQIARQKD
jgi:phosphoesterase RecJ-like protein